MHLKVIFLGVAGVQSKTLGVTVSFLRPCFLPRSCEYLNLLAPEWSGVKKEALDRMPVMDEQAFRERWVVISCVLFSTAFPVP